MCKYLNPWLTSLQSIIFYQFRSKLLVLSTFLYDPFISRWEREKNIIIYEKINDETNETY